MRAVPPAIVRVLVGVGLLITSIFSIADTSSRSKVPIVGVLTLSEAARPKPSKPPETPSSLWDPFYRTGAGRQSHSVT